MRSYPQVPVVLVVTEGYTEKTFLNHLRERNMGCSLTVMKSPEANPGNSLDILPPKSKTVVSISRGETEHSAFSTQIIIPKRS